MTRLRVGGGTKRVAELHSELGPVARDVERTRVWVAREEVALIVLRHCWLQETNNKERRNSSAFYTRAFDYSSAFSIMASEPVDVRWMERPCSRDFSPSNFGNDLQDYPFDVNEPDVWFPSKTYMRGTFTVSGDSKVGDVVVPPTVAQQIALAEGCFANCYNQASFKIGARSFLRPARLRPA